MTHSFYTAVTQQVLLLGAKSWVLTKRMESALDAFQGRVARRLTGGLPRRGRDGKWVYPSLSGALKEAGVVRARTLVLQRQNTVAQFIATRPILGLCEVAERRRGTQVPQRWWEQSGIDWKLVREKGERAAAAAEQTGATAEETETPGSGTRAGSEPVPTRGWTTGNTGEEASLGASGSRGAEWSGAEY